MLIFLKLGGSLITDKTIPYYPRLKILDSLAGQIARALRESPELQLIVGHGSGSFGHEAASKYNTRKGVSGPESWKGFAEVWYQASALNRLVVESFRRSQLPAVTLAPLSAITAKAGKIIAWDLKPLKTSMANGLLPIIHGDVAFDEVRGGTILSTEDLFSHLAHQLNPNRILLAGLEEGVWKDFPTRTQLLRDITPRTFSEQSPGLGQSVGVDVTGGMQTKVIEMLSLVDQIPGLEIVIFSGEKPDNILHALIGENPGTCMHS
jgi:isopentenyl phosphate kinase